MKSWKKLEEQSARFKKLSLIELFKNDPSRPEKFSFFNGEIFFDYSRNLCDEELLAVFGEYLREIDFSGWREKMWRGDIINHTEQRSVLHIALRNFNRQHFSVEGKEINAEIKSVLKRMENFCLQVHSGKWRGYSRKKIDTVVNIGIGGSDLGPRMVVDALRDYYIDQKMHFFFLANIDGKEIDFVLPRLNPQTTLFIVTSKTFNTEETLTNALTLRDWLIGHYGTDEAVRAHFVAVSTAIDKVQAFGINRENCFGFWDWVGGRFSLSSAVGLSIMLAIGPENFNRFLQGMAETDQNFQTASLENNLPLLMALLAFWNNNFLGCQQHLVLPYSRALELFPAYLQQLIMESNGKLIDRQGKEVDYRTSAAIWGGVGTNSQHSFFQLLHQGTVDFSADLIAIWKGADNYSEHQQRLLANYFAQSEALAFGVSEAELEAEECPSELIPYRQVRGNHPHNLLILEKLTPFSLGKLIALYEQRVFAEGVLLNINSFDQWGVELGKKIVRRIYPLFAAEEIFDRTGSAGVIFKIREKWNGLTVTETKGKN